MDEPNAQLDAKTGSSFFNAKYELLMNLTDVQLGFGHSLRYSVDEAIFQEGDHFHQSCFPQYA